MFSFFTLSAVGAKVSNSVSAVFKKPLSAKFFSDGKVKTYDSPDVNDNLACVLFMRWIAITSPPSILATDSGVFVNLFDKSIYLQQSCEGQRLLVIENIIKADAMIVVLTHHVAQGNKPEQIEPFPLLALRGGCVKQVKCRFEITSTIV